MSNRLIQQLDTSAPGSLPDEYLAMAYNIEESLICAGAEPGKDYTILDLYKLAQPFALELFKTKDKMEYAHPSRKTV